MQLLELIKKHKVRTVLIIAAFFLLPILITHSLFKLNAPCELLRAEWSAGDLLGYWGSIFGAAATIIAVVLTIQFTLANQREERKLSIKPYLQSMYHPIYRIDDASKADGKTIFMTYPHQNDKEELISSSLETPYLLSKIKKDSTEEAIIDALGFVKEYYILHYSLSNVGAGNAIKISFTIDDKISIPAFSLAMNSDKNFIIILKATLLHEEKRIIRFAFTYEDAASIARYEQSENIILYSEDDQSLNTRQNLNDLITAPQEINL